MACTPSVATDSFVILRTLILGLDRPTSGPSWRERLKVYAFITAANTGSTLLWNQ